MKIGILLILFALFIDPSKIGKANTAKAEAKKAFNSGDYKTALEKYKYLVDSLGVNEDEVMMNLANSYFNLNDTANAVGSYQRLINSDNARIKSNAHQQLGVMSNRQGKFEEALSEFKEALKTDPTNEDARFNYEMVKKKLEEEKKKQQSRKDQNKDQNQDEKDKEKKEKDKQDQQSKDDKKDKKDDQQKSDQQKKDEEEKKKAEEKRKEQQQQQEKESKDKKNDQFDAEKLKDMKITENKARMILEAMKNQEIQYLQQNKRKATKPKDKSKPDW